ncbi:MAG: protocatechuate 3,4-dioxygenase [Gammaproteobacteria bacterium]|jgi:protocatechuate 3,4-dioxygenase beta subunit
MNKYSPTPTLHSPKKISRRSLLKVGLTAGLVSYGITNTKQVNSGTDTLKTHTLRQTPRQTEGPFYPIEEQDDKDVDLTQIKEKTQPAKGQVIRVQGLVLDTDGNALNNAFVEIWQANTWGRYRHKRDPNTAPLDPNFQGWGQTTTADNGRYGFKTILPGAYPAGPDWTRPPHIHFKVTRQGFYGLTTQMYFPDQKLNDVDLILQNLPTAQRDMVIAKRDHSDPNDAPTFVFDIVLLRAS